MKYRIATAAEVRKNYVTRGDTVKISRDGCVKFKRDGDGPWLDGRWVEEYRITERGVVLT